MARTPIDFTSGLDKAELITRNDGGHTSLWIGVLAELVNGVKNGPGEYGKMYKIGDFSNASGARTTIRNLTKREDLPGEFEMDSVVVDVRDDDGNLVYEQKTVKVRDDDGDVVTDKDGNEVTKTANVVKRVSELWAAVVEPEDGDDADGDDEPDDVEDDATPDEDPEDGDDEPDDEPEPEPTTRTRKRRAAA